MGSRAVPIAPTESPGGFSPTSHSPKAFNEPPRRRLIHSTRFDNLSHENSTPATARRFQRRSLHTCGVAHSLRTSLHFPEFGYHMRRVASRTGSGPAVVSAITTDWHTSHTEVLHGRTSVRLR